MAQPHTAARVHATQAVKPDSAGTAVGAAALPMSSSIATGQSTGQSTPGGGGRSRFDRDELAIVLSHYDLGVIEQVQEFPRGSRKAPKLLLKADRGTYLLKRRA